MKNWFSNNRNSQYLGKWDQNLGKCPNSISPERLVIWSWFTPHFNRNSQFSIRVSYNIYPSDQRKYFFGPKWPKRGKQAQFYISQTTNGNLGVKGDKNGEKILIQNLLIIWSLINTFLLSTGTETFVFVIYYTFQATGSTVLGQKGKKG